MNFYLVTFIIVSILVGAGGTYKFFASHRMISAVIFLIGSIAIFIFYGIRWFGKAGTPFNSAPVHWPPYINMCPDYLTYFKRGSGTSTVDTCIDRIGVSRNNRLDVFPASGTPPSDDKYYFPLATASQDPVSKRNELCMRTVEYGLTWEGVSDGETCYSIEGTGGAIIPTAATGCPSV